MTPMEAKKILDVIAEHFAPTEGETLILLDVEQAAKFTKDCADKDVELSGLAGVESHLDRATAGLRGAFSGMVPLPHNERIPIRIRKDGAGLVIHTDQLQAIANKIRSSGSGQAI